MKQCYDCKQEKEEYLFVVTKNKATNWCKECKKFYGKNRYRKNRGYWLLYNYGINEKQFNELLANQMYCCKICGDSWIDYDETKESWHVDHDHSCCPNSKTCGKCIRGILCPFCNRMLGQAKEDPNRLLAGYNYLLKD